MNCLALDRHHCHGHPASEATASSLAFATVENWSNSGLLLLLRPWQLAAVPRY